MNKLFATVCGAALMLAGSAQAGDTPSPDGAKVYFINIEDGDTLKAPFLVQFGLAGMGVAPAGTEKDKTGHHHLLINRAPLGEGEDGLDEFDYPLPADEHHKHFGGGQTEFTVDLPPGTHTLQLVLGDMNHIPHLPAVVSPVITVTVE